MTMKLTHDEWLRAPVEKIACVKVRAWKGWSDLEKEVVDKWLNENTTKWWYSSDETYAFAEDSDRTAFIFWLKSEPFHELKTEI